MSHLLIESTDFVAIFVPLAAMLFVPPCTALADVIHRRVTEKQNGIISGPIYRVRHNAYTLTAAIAGMLATGLIALLFPILYLCEVNNAPTLDITIAMACVGGFFAMMCALLLIAFARWGITVSEDKIVYTPHFSKRIILTWKDINNIKCSKNADTYQILINKFGKRIYFNPKILIGGEKFLNDLKQHGVLFVGTYI